eukprot:gene22885-biopygen2784
MRDMHDLRDMHDARYARNAQHACHASHACYACHTCGRGPDADRTRGTRYNLKKRTRTGRGPDVGVAVSPCTGCTVSARPAGSARPATRAGSPKLPGGVLPTPPGAGRMHTADGVDPTDTPGGVLPTPWARPAGPHWPARPDRPGRGGWAAAGTHDTHLHTWSPLSGTVIHTGPATMILQTHDGNFFAPQSPALYNTDCDTNLGRD